MVMEQIARDGVCPFCLENLKKYHTKPILWSNSDWLVTKNDTPYEGSRIHILMICKKHLPTVVNMEKRLWSSLGEAIDWTTKEFKITGGSFLMRFGDMNYNGASVQHLHSHIIVGVKKGKNTSSLKVKIGHRKDS
jgi:diadenosine tetraphosphate (Ap4A) HIT family hydrolase